MDTSCLILVVYLVTLWYVGGREDIEGFGFGLNGRAIEMILLKFSACCWVL